MSESSLKNQTLLSFLVHVINFWCRLQDSAASQANNQPKMSYQVNWTPGEELKGNINFKYLFHICSSHIQHHFLMLNYQC